MLLPGFAQAQTGAVLNSVKQRAARRWAQLPALADVQLSSREALKHNRQKLLHECFLGAAKMCVEASPASPLC